LRTGFTAPELSAATRPDGTLCDIYSVGMLLAAMATGCEQPDGTARRGGYKTRTGDSRLDRVIARATARDPRRRHQSCAEIEQSLAALAGKASDHLATAPPVVPTPPALPQATSRETRRVSIIEPAPPSRSSTRVPHSGVEAKRPGTKPPASIRELRPVLIAAGSLAATFLVAEIATEALVTPTSTLVIGSTELVTTAPQAQARVATRLSADSSVQMTGVSFAGESGSAGSNPEYFAAEFAMASSIDFETLTARSDCSQHRSFVWRPLQPGTGPDSGVITVSTDCPDDLRYVDFAGTTRQTGRTLYVEGKDIRIDEMRTLLAGLHLQHSG
jgi:serine/threonine protein kinase